jgi:hypothetical protein
MKSRCHDLPSATTSANLQAQLIQYSLEAEHRGLTQTQQLPRKPEWFSCGGRQGFAYQPLNLTLLWS